MNNISVLTAETMLMLSRPLGWVHVAASVAIEQAEGVKLDLVQHSQSQTVTNMHAHFVDKSLRNYRTARH